MSSSVETSDGRAARTRLRAAAAGSQDTGHPGAAAASVDSPGVDTPTVAPSPGADLVTHVVAAVSAQPPKFVSIAVADHNRGAVADHRRVCAS